MSFERQSKESPEQELKRLEGQLAKMKAQPRLSTEAHDALERIEERILALRGQIDFETIERVSENEDNE